MSVEYNFVTPFAQSFSHNIGPQISHASSMRDAELVREWVEGETLEDELIDMLDAIGKGYSVSEIMWETSERQWMPMRLEYRDPRWFEFDTIDGRTLRLRGLENHLEPLAPFKFVTHTFRAKSGLPIRGGFARMVAWFYLFSNFGLKDWVQFVETYGQPTRIGKYPPSATQDERAVLLRALTNLGADAAAMIPESMMIELVKGTEGGASSQSAHQSLLSYIDALISKAILGQTLTTEAGERGARSLGEVHDAVRHDIERSDAAALSQGLTRDVARPIVALNHGARRRYPRIVIGREETLDVARTAEALAKLVPLGLRVPESAVRELVGFEAPESDDVLMARTPATPDAGDARGEARALAQAIDRFLRSAGATDPPPAPPAGAHNAGGDDLRALAATLAQSDPVPALTRRTRATLGPLVDAWGEHLGAVIGAADSLEAARNWLDAGAVESLEALTVADRLAPALIAAELAGRYDVDTDPVGADVARASAAVALGTASAEHTQLPFNEQIAFFRRKLSLPTQSWTDIWQSQHDVAFVVAGAARDDLVSDLRGAVDQAIAEGTTLATFRGDFDAIVAKHGWSYKGGRSWRTEVIYGTNLRTSYAAGRYRQLKDVAERRPYWRYRHSDASERPRHDHLAWDGLVLRHDDPWWGTHYPPNGWGCKCFVEALNARGIARLGKSGPDTAPDVDMRTVTVGEKGPSPRTVQVPEGIDPGWAYAPGQTATLGPAVRRHLETSARRAPRVAAAGAAATLARDAVLDALGDEWRRWRRDTAGRGRQAEAFTLGAMHPDVMDWLRREQAVEVANAAVTVTRRELAHAARADKTARGAALDDADLDRLPAIIARPDAVLHDTERPGELLYVFEPAIEDGPKGKVIVRVNFTTKLALDGADRTGVTTNSVRSAGYVQADNLRESRYRFVQGAVE